MAARACILACCLCPNPSRWQPGMPVHALALSQCHHMDFSTPVCMPDMSQHHHVVTWAPLFACFLYPVPPHGNTGTPVPTPSPTSWCHKHACFHARHVPALPQGDAGMLVCAPAIPHPWHMFECTMSTTMWQCRYACLGPCCVLEPVSHAC